MTTYHYIISLTFERGSFARHGLSTPAPGVGRCQTYQGILEDALDGARAVGLTGSVTTAFFSLEPELLPA